MRPVSYQERCKKLSLQSLEKRRLLQDLALCYKIVCNLVCGDLSNYGLDLAAASTRGHSLKLAIPFSRVEAWKRFFASRVVGPWNSLPNEVVTMKSLKAFKISIRDLPVLNQF